MGITDAINVKCDGQTVTEIVDKDGNTLKTLTAEVENADQYCKPSGSKSITANGTYDVTEYKSAVVNVPVSSESVTPSIGVNENGLITVSGNGVNTVTHQLSSEDDADFVASNILKGVSIFGLAGTAEGSSGFTAIQIEARTSTTEYTLDGTTITPDSNYGSLLFPLKGDGLYWFNYVSGGTTTNVYRFLVAKYKTTDYFAFKTRGNNKAEFSAVTGATATSGGNYLYFIGSATLSFRTSTYQGFYIPLTNFDGQTDV